MANHECKTGTLLLAYYVDGTWFMHGFSFTNNGLSAINGYQNHTAFFIGL